MQNREVHLSVEEILEHHLLPDEEPNTKALIYRLRPIVQRGYFTKDEFLEMCRWKSPRPLRHYQNNTSEQVEGISRKVFAQSDDNNRISLGS